LSLTIKAVAPNPERRLPERLTEMDEEKMQRQMEFLLEWQAQFAVELGELKENVTRLGENVTRLEGVVERVVGVVERVVVNVERLAQSTRERLEAVENREDETDRKIAALVDSQIQTEESLRNLSDTLNRHIVEGHKEKKDEPEG
jgi:deoxyribodipyrimidine photolyase